MESSGPNPALPGLTLIGILTPAVPESMLTLKLSPIPRRAPPALGTEIEGRSSLPEGGGVSWFVLPFKASGANGPLLWPGDQVGPELWACAVGSGMVVAIFNVTSRGVSVIS